MARLTPFEYFLPKRFKRKKDQKALPTNRPAVYVPPKVPEKHKQRTPAEYQNWLSRQRGGHTGDLVTAYGNMGVQYIMWQSQQDGKVRSTHAELHGEIVRIGTRFSNGLLFPGDFSEYLPEEQVNCRCKPIPFWVPSGYMPLSDRFRANELLKVRDVG